MKLPILILIFASSFKLSASTITNNLTNETDPKIVITKVEETSTETVKHLQDQFMKAYGLFATTDFIESKVAFKPFLNEPSNGFQNLSLALYYYSKSCLNTEDLVEAVNVYQDLLAREDFQNESLYEQAFYEMALCQMKLNEKEAIPMWKKIAAEFSIDYKNAAVHYLAFCKSNE